MQATSLPFIVAATAIGLDLGLLDGAQAAALIGAGLLSVLLFPAAGLAVLSAGESAPGSLSGSGGGSPAPARGVPAR